ncbi:MAG TPA: histidine kinase [Chitinophagaceae bacterium]|nr:histidine kinase [Chitinophagaceae bacterium]
MIKDLILRIVFIPLLGIGLPLISGIITYSEYSPLQLVLADLFFILTSYLIWQGCNFIHSRLRPLYKPISNPFSKIAAVCFVTGLYGACTGGLSSLIWMKISLEKFDVTGVYKFIAACVAAVIIFTLIYEILFLSKERELDNKIVDQLDRERSQAELQALTNEMDPHFIFNSLNTLNHLIVNEPEQAYLFNNRLAQVYKYFLINKNKELIPLRDELEFIESYFYLLQIRHDDKLLLHTNLDEKNGGVMIPPCSLQILVENAIKHNEFSTGSPLHIKVTANDHYLRVSNNIKPKQYAVNSTGIGLKNLRSRYKILFRKDISIETTREDFIVKLPLIT